MNLLFEAQVCIGAVGARERLGQGPMFLEERLGSPVSPVPKGRTGSRPSPSGLKPFPLHQPMVGPGLEPPTPKEGRWPGSQAWPVSLSPCTVTLAPVL